MTIQAEGGSRRADLGSFLIAAALGALGLFMLWETFSIPVQVSYARVGPRVFPTLVGAAMVVNAIWREPLPSLGGLAILAAGIPVYWLFQGRRTTSG